MLKYLLVFVAGLLVGANLVYYVMNRDRVDPRAAVVFHRESTQHALPADTPEAPAARVEAGPISATEPDSGVVTTPEAGAPARTEPESRSARDPDRSKSSTDRIDTPVAPTASGLIVPVRGITPSQLSNTFDDARGQGRVHEALDIMAARGTPVLAVADGTVEKLFTSDRGGLTIYQFEPTGRHAYYYAHLDRYAPGLSEGDTLEQGQVIGYVGSTGNASDDAPHLHFAIFVLGPEKRWWEGTAINPYPLLTAKETRLRPGGSPLGGQDPTPL